jgi:site-specific DNA-methyltransferase (adenine-specific)
MKYQILQGDNRTTLKSLPDNSIDAIVTDPPYGIDFLGKSWDANTGALETYQECLRVLKPGGHILAFSAARTYHHLAVTLEQAGFEIRDQIMWIYSSGFPKSQDIGRSIQRSIGVKQTKKNPTASKATFNNVLSEAQDKQRDNSSDDCKPGSAEQVVCTDPEALQWSGWGTQLKPAHEPIALARKPIKLSIAQNCQVHGVGALNIDATRISIEGSDTRSGGSDGWDRVEFSEAEPNKYNGDGYVPNEQGRFPSNVMGDIPDYQKYFYCPKVSRRERHIGFDDPGAMFSGSRFDVYMPTNGTTDPEKTIMAVEEKLKDKGNNHPTVKPIELMKYLIKLITPKGGIVLDPFNGSGSTGCAAVELGMEYIGCELDPAYVEIAQRRIEAWHAQANPTTFHTLFDRE